MKITETTWLIRLLIGSMFLLLVFEVDGKMLCGRQMFNKPKLPAHTRLASKQKKRNHVTLTCHKGYYFSKGRNTKALSCKSFRSLSLDELPKCKGCGQPPSLRNGTVKLSRDKTSVGSVATYSCDVGFSFVGSRKQKKCRHNLRWSGARSRITCAKNRCPDPGNVRLRNGNVTFSDRKFEEFSTISFQCNAGYELLLGEEDVFCRGGKWSSRLLAICGRKRCPRPDIPENGRKFGSKYYIGDTVQFYCNSGFSLYGSKNRTCQGDKTWSGTMTLCDDGQSHCRNPGTPVGAVKRGKKYNEEDVVYYKCRLGLKLFSGSRNRTCLKNKTWSGTPPKCVDKNYKEFRPINETAMLLKEDFVNSLLQTTCSGINVSCPNTRGRTLDRKYKGGLDLIFVLDTSSSITEKKFKIAKKIVKKIVDIFGVDKRVDGDGTHIACVTYGTGAQMAFSFNDFSVQTKKRALKTIGQIQYTRGGTATRLALELVRNVILPSTKRSDSTKALFLITDGESNIGGSPNKAAKYLKERKNVEIYVIGIGPRVKDESLLKLASNHKNVFPIKNFTDFEKIMDQIVNSPMEDYSECGTSPFSPHGSRARIVGGEKTDEENWPWAVKILYKGEHICGGTLINLQFVLTAAHCFDGNIKFFDVQVLFQDKERTILTSIKLYIHPKYNPFTLVNDIALVHIRKLNRFTKNKQAICLPRYANAREIIKDGNNMFAVGWGRTTALKPVRRDMRRDKGKTEPSFKHVRLPFMADTKCEENVNNKTAQGLKNFVFNSATQFCAGDITGKNDTCKGDSGGPGMVLLKHPVSGKWRWFQIGIISWGHGCAQLGEVGFYTKVSAFVGDWIDKKLAFL